MAVANEKDMGVDSDYEAVNCILHFYSLGVIILYGSWQGGTGLQ
jgi:hypothetical protein